jgi:hypothetical protein
MDVGRLRPEDCTHTGPVIVEEVEEGGYVARCLLCATEGPVRETSEEALAALQDLASEDS